MPTPSAQETAAQQLTQPEPLAKLLPHFRFEEVHSLVIEAPAAEVMQAVVVQSMDDDRLTQTLLKVRTALVRRLPRYRHVRAFGMHSFTPLHQSADWYCLGLAGRFWRLDFGLDSITTPQDFILYQRNARLVLAFHAEAINDTSTRLTTVTRIQTFDAMATLMMTLYWLAIRPASGLIRMRMLRRIKRQVERLSR